MDSIEDIQLLSTRKAAELLGFTTAYMRKLRSIGKGPPFVRLSSRYCAYRVVDLRAWLHVHMRGRNEDDRHERKNSHSVNPKCKKRTNQKPQEAY